MESEATSTSSSAVPQGPLDFGWFRAHVLRCAALPNAEVSHHAIKNARADVTTGLMGAASRYEDSLKLGVETYFFFFFDFCLKA